MSPDPRTTFDLVFDLQEQRAFGVTRNSKGLKQFLAGPEALQTHLGEIHDGEARAEFLKTEFHNLFNKSGHRAVFAAGVLMGATHDAGPHLAQAVQAYSTLATAKPF